MAENAADGATASDHIPAALLDDLADRIWQKVEERRAAAGGQEQTGVTSPTHEAGTSGSQGTGTTQPGGKKLDVRAQ